MWASVRLQYIFSKYFKNILKRIHLVRLSELEVKITKFSEVYLHVVTRQKQIVFSLTITNCVNNHTVLGFASYCFILMLCTIS